MSLGRLLSLAATTLLVILAAASQAQLSSSMADPDAIEEDWVLVIANPNPLEVGPQITTVMSPVADASAPRIAFDLNYREFPSFSPGGMQVQVWSNGEVGGIAGQGGGLFSTANEVVTWTQQMSISNGTLLYDVGRGQSTTWGNFGQGDNLHVSVPTNLTSMAAYQPQVSANRSGASWQANHVSTLTLKQVRYLANGQIIWTDTNPRVIVDNTDQSVN